VDWESESEETKGGSSLSGTSTRASTTTTRLSGSLSGSMNRDDEADAISLTARLAEKKKLKTERGNLAFEFGLDAFDATFKLMVVMMWFFNPSATDPGTGDKVPQFTVQKDFLVPLLVNLTIAVTVTISITYLRLCQMKEMKFVAQYGYSYKWQKDERLASGAGGSDPRIDRDARARVLLHQKIRAAQACFVDLPWVITNVARGATSVSGLAPLGVFSIAVAGFGFGMKFSNVVALLKQGAQKKVQMYTSLPSEARVGTGASNKVDVSDAIAQAWEAAAADLGDGKAPSLVLCFMTANHDIETGLKALRDLIGPDVPFSGCTLCQGAMIGASHKRKDMTSVGIWAIHDPDGLYVLGHVDIDEVGANGEAKRTVRYLTKKAADLAKKSRMQRAANMPDNPVVQKKPSFVWINPPPGPEDQVLSGLTAAIGSGIDIIGGSSADNDVTGKWRQWNSEIGVRSNCCVFVIANCSAVVKGCAFTGYSATPKCGLVTELAGPRHIKTIDHKPAAHLYNEWCSGHFSGEMQEAEDSNILGPSSVYPLGQIVGQDWDGEPCYRTMHPHLLVKKDGSLTLFSDVALGDQIVTMAGTKDNIVNRISSVALHIQRSTGIPVNEFRGALVVFCAGAMMYAGEGMDESCQKLDAALGGVNYLGIHTFGEQGPFPDGTNKHGNLMFSALVITSRRSVIKLQNVDTGDIVLEGSTKFEEIVMAQGVVGGLPGNR